MTWGIYGCDRFARRTLVSFRNIGICLRTSRTLNHFSKALPRSQQPLNIAHGKESITLVRTLVGDVRKDEETAQVFGKQLRELLKKDPSPTVGNFSKLDDAIGSWQHAEDVLQKSLREIRTLRARVERNKEENDPNLQQMSSIICDCVLLLDRLTGSLPMAEEYATNCFFQGHNEESVDTMSGALSTGVLDHVLLNEILKEWMVVWKLQNSFKIDSKIPTPVKMAEKVDQYRSRWLVLPDPRSFNLLLNAMIPDRIDQRAVKLADDYLDRLLQAQEELSSSTAFVDTYSFATVMKGWVRMDQPEKAQKWLDRITDSPSIEPNAVIYSIAIHGWARAGNPQKAESILQAAVEKTLKQSKESDHSVVIKEKRMMFVDRIAFHTVMDAWAAKASSKSSSPTNDEIPAVRAKELLQSMEDLADRYPESFEHLRPNDESWHKLIVATALQRQGPGISVNDFGPRAAETFLNAFETKCENSVTPAIVLNRILQAYCTDGTKMEEAEDFFYRRHNKTVEPETSQKPKVRDNPHSASTIQTPSIATFPNQMTFHTILSGWVKAAEVAKRHEQYQAKKKKKKKKRKEFSESSNRIRNPHGRYKGDTPLRAEYWLEKMLQNPNVGAPSLKAYSMVLQTWSLSTQYHSDAADRAEELLKRYVWKGGKHGDDDGVTICTNIVLRAWSNQASFARCTADRNVQFHSDRNRSVTRCIRLLSDFLVLVKERPHLKPSAETFRPVLHAIVTQSNGMTPIQKFERYETIIKCMRDTFRIQPRPDDTRKLKRLQSLKERYLQRCSKFV